MVRIYKTNNRIQFVFLKEKWLATVMHARVMALGVTYRSMELACRVDVSPLVFQ